jgi:hypothetical protein
MPKFQRNIFPTSEGLKFVGSGISCLFLSGGKQSDYFLPRNRRGAYFARPTTPLVEEEAPSSKHEVV